jgi:predicted nucleotide-binding protein/uncharacterized protein YegP (UPF0339 family)
MPDEFQMYKDHQGLFRFRLVSGSGQIYASTKGYRSKDECLKEIESFRRSLSRPAFGKNDRTDLKEEQITLGAIEPRSKKIFIVHGRDEGNKNILREMLLRWGLQPIILAEEPNRGRTLIEKLIDHTSDVGYVFVIMTADDAGALRSEFHDFADRLIVGRQATTLSILDDLNRIIKPRVRQNVIFEYGLCVGSVGRYRVCLLVEKDNIEIPTDVLGYGYYAFKEKVSECETQIRKELEAVGYSFEES